MYNDNRKCCSVKSERAYALSFSKLEPYKGGLTMTVEQMRAAIKKSYDTDSWKKKVSKMSDAQIIAVYHKFAVCKKLK